IRFHLLERTRRNIAAGMTQAEAQADASLRFGSIERAKDQMRSARVTRINPTFVTVAVGAVVALVGLYEHHREPVYDLTSDIVAPVPVSAPRPQYTAEAMQAKIQGTVGIRCIVRPSGSCDDLTVVTSLDRRFGLDDEAVRTMASWRFRPALRRGTPVS